MLLSVLQFILVNKLQAWPLVSVSRLRVQFYLIILFVRIILDVASTCLLCMIIVGKLGVP